MKAVTSFCLALFYVVHAFATPEPFYLAARDGIYRGTIDSDSGRLTPLALEQHVAGSLFLAQSPVHPVIYTGLESNIVAFSENASGGLIPWGQVDVAGKNYCHLTCDQTGRYLLAVEYDLHKLVAVSLGAAGDPQRLMSTRTFHGAGPNKVRQEASHPHSVYFDPENRHIYVCDLGADRIWIFNFDEANGSFMETSSQTVQPGSGPRHLAFDASGKKVYVNGELGANLSVFDRDEKTGALHFRQVVSTLTPDRPKTDGGTAEIVMHPSGKWLYVSNRLGDTIAVFALGPDGGAKLIEDAPSLAQEVWSIQIDPSGQWLIAAGKRDNRLVVFKIDSATGKLTPTNVSASVEAPICVLFVPAVKS
jgi:6-phosphogluconolactonase